MARKNGRDNSKMKRQDNYRKYSGIAVRNTLQYYVSQDVKRKNNSVKHSYNNEMDRQKGLQWFNSGLLLDDAPEELRNNKSFIDGFNKGYRIKLVNDNLYDLGREYFERGISLEDAPKNYINNPYFIDGYNKAMKKIR